MSSTLTRWPLGVSSMPAMSRMDLVLALTMMVPSGITDQTGRVPGLACTRAPDRGRDRRLTFRANGGLRHAAS